MRRLLHKYRVQIYTSGFTQGAYFNTVNQDALFLQMKLCFQYNQCQQAFKVKKPAKKLHALQLANCFTFTYYVINVPLLRKMNK